MGDSLAYVNLGSGAEVVDLALSTNAYVENSNVHHSCALLSTGQIKCWGAGNYGQLGYGATASLGGGPRARWAII